ncbi:aminoglycoside phosphotransferase family protein [Microbacterium sp. AZCO]|uniref:aminoglycoside phosphotransferase family protein n=1 Tax=Microbacterium sp. AZCO TaxID=3142976 RepID=UPI0031F343FA
MPAAEVRLSEDLVRRLVVAQSGIRDAASLPLSMAASGWDCELWRLGPDLAVRLPRRALAAPLVVNEQWALPRIGPLVEATGIRVPVPLVAGRPVPSYPWPWSIVPWFEGVAGLDVPRPDRSPWAVPLAGALHALHVEAPPDAPLNPVRGVPLADRAAIVGERLALLRGRHPGGLLDVAATAWRRGLAAAPWSRPPVWIHGDLHPGNLVARDGTLVAIVDFGDVTSGDPAYDLAVAWIAFDADGRELFARAAGADAATWIRARAWAAAFAVLLLAHSDDNPGYAQLGFETLEEIRGDQASSVARTT